MFYHVHSLKLHLGTVKTSLSSSIPPLRGENGKGLWIDGAPAQPRQGAGRHRGGYGRQGEEGACEERVCCS